MKAQALRLPHTLVLIYIMVVLTVAATWIVPGGRIPAGREGRPDWSPWPDSYQRVASQPQGLGALFVSPVQRLHRRRGHHRHRLRRRRGFHRHPEDRGHRPPSSTTSPFTFGRSRALRVLLIPVTMIIFSLGGARLRHVRGDHALRPRLRPPGPVARLRHDRRRGHAASSARRRGSPARSSIPSPSASPRASPACPSIRGSATG